MGTDIFTDQTLRWAAKDGTCLACGTRPRNWEAHVETEKHRRLTVHRERRADALARIEARK